MSDKRFATAQARAALIGATLHRIEDDRGAIAFVLSRWALTRQLRTIEDVEAWLDRVSGVVVVGIDGGVKVVLPTAD